MCPLINTPPLTEGGIIRKPIFRFLGVIFDGDHDFEGPRSPKAHLDTVLTKPVTPPGHPLYARETARPRRTTAVHARRASESLSKIRLYRSWLFLLPLFLL